MGEAYRLLPVCVGVRTVRSCPSWEEAPSVLAGPGQNPYLSAWWVVGRCSLGQDEVAGGLKASRTD